jgi:hypothetical protein
VVITRHGLFYISRIEGKAYKFVETLGPYQQPGEGLNEISLGGLYHWFAQNLLSLEDKSNPIYGNGCHAVYDPELIRILFTEIHDNKSWTISYDILTESWTAFHSYMPRMYFSIPDGFHSWSKEKFWKHNIRGKHCMFYNDPEDFVVEITSLSSPLLTRVWEDVTLQSIVEQYNSAIDDYIEIHTKMFDKVMFYNSKQSSGILNVEIREKSNSDWMMETIHHKPNTIRANRVEHNWRMNELRDMVVNYSVPFFLNNSGSPVVDKIINPAAFGMKQWTDMQSFRDRYLAIRLFLSKFAERNIQLTTSYTLQTEQISMR